MATPVPLSVVNVALPNTGDSGNISVTAPSGANACVIGGTYYISDNNVPTSLTGSQLASTTNGTLRTATASSGAHMGNYAAAFKVNATGSQTIRLQRTGGYGEGPTCQIVWLTVDDPDDFVRTGGFLIDSQSSVPDTLSVVLNSALTDLVIGMFGTDGSSAAPTAPTGTTQIGTTQTTNADSSLAFQVTTPGASTTTITAGARDFPTLFGIALKAGSGGSTTDLVIQNLAVASQTGAPALTLDTTLAAANLAVASQLGAPALTLDTTLAPANLAVASQLGAGDLTVTPGLLVDNLTVASQLGAVDLTLDTSLVAAGLDVASQLGNVDLTLDTTLAPANLAVASQLDNATLSTENTVDLVAAGLNVASQLGEPALTLDTTLAAQNLSVASQLSPVDLTLDTTLAPANLAVASQLSNVTLSTDPTLTAADLAVASQLESPTLTAEIWLGIQDLSVGAKLDNVTLTGDFPDDTATGGGAGYPVRLPPDKKRRMAFEDPPVEPTPVPKPKPPISLIKEALAGKSPESVGLHKAPVAPTVAPSRPKFTPMMAALMDDDD